MKRSEFTKGIIKENPVLVIVLGCCPTLATSTSLKNALGMGVAASFVLVGSNIIISLIKGFIPDKIRIPCYIVVIATFVVLVELYLGAFQPALNRSLGIFVPLIVVNCIVLGRAEAFAARHGVADSALDGLGMGVGFTLTLAIMATIREFLGNGTFWGLRVLPGMKPALMMVLPPGALLTLGLLMGCFNQIKNRGSSR